LWDSKLKRARNVAAEEQTLKHHSVEEALEEEEGVEVPSSSVLVAEEGVEEARFLD